MALPDENSETSICNLALSHIGNSKELSNVETDQSEEASACRRYYLPALKQAHRNFAWPFAKNLGVALGLVEEDPNSEWAFSYRYPADCKMFKRILSGDRNDTRQSKVPYKLGRDDQGLLIFTDKADAESEYTILERDPTRYPADFVMAFSMLLAGYIATRVTSGDPFKLGPRSFSLYNSLISNAREAALNEEQEEEPPESEFIRARQ